MNIILDESHCRENLFPFTLTRHTAHLFIGTCSIINKWKQLTHIPIDLEIETPQELNMQFQKEGKINLGKEKIFISHSSADIDIVEKVIDILEAIGVPSDKIFCSSFEGYGIRLGSDFLQDKCTFYFIYIDFLYMFVPVFL